MENLIAELVNDTTKTSSAAGDLKDFDNISYTLKQVFASGKQEEFEQMLKTFIHRKEGDIERLCSLHYQEFVAAIEQLLKVKTETVSLKSKIILLNSQINDSGAAIISRKKELIGFKRILVNCDAGLDVVKTCLFVLDIAYRVNLQIESRKYYSALRMLDDLHNVHLKKIIQYNFAQHLQSCIAPLKESIRESVLQELNLWFVKVREIAGPLGRIAMQNTKLRQASVRAQLEAAALTEYSTATNIGIAIEIAMSEENIVDVFQHPECQLEFRSLYQCSYIHLVLRKLEELKVVYEENRQLQAEVIFASNFNFKNENTEDFQAFLHEIIGYFIIESVVVNTTQNFRPTSKVEALWDDAIARVNQLLIGNLVECASAALFLSIKVIVISFMQTLEQYNYNASKLGDLMISLFDRYAELLKSDYERKVVESVENDEYAPMIVNSKAELDIVNDMYQIVDRQSTANNEYPMQLSFSPGVPKICLLLSEFIASFYRFAEGFQQQNNEMDDLLKKSLENMLNQSVNGAYTQLLTNNLSQAVQILVNLGSFETACAKFEDLLTQHRSLHMGTRVSLTSVATFRNAKGNCEKKIFELVNRKIDEFLELADYDWYVDARIMRRMALSVSNSPSSYLNELIDYITSVIASTLSNLPSTLRQYVYFGAFDHLAGSLLGLLIDQNVKKINLNFIMNFDIDLSILEKFAVEHKDISIGDCFAELRQTLNFLKSDNYEEYLNASIKTKQYPKVRNHNLIVLLDKLKHDAGMFGKVTLAEKAKRKSIDVLLKALKI